MIKKERLEQLIEQGATIYKLTKFSFSEIKLDKCNVVMNGGLYMSKDSVGRWAWIEDLFETKEDAEEYEEFGNITRTERLELPSWEEVENDFKRLKNGTYTIAEYKYLISLNLRIDKPAISQIVLLTDTDNYYWNLSRENYNEARRLCVKLFKGENNG